jgi:hypothetical protein
MPPTPVVNVSTPAPVVRVIPPASATTFTSPTLAERVNAPFWVQTVGTRPVIIGAVSVKAVVTNTHRADVIEAFPSLKVDVVPVILITAVVRFMDAPHVSDMVPATAEAVKAIAPAGPKLSKLRVLFEDIYPPTFNAPKRAESPLTNMAYTEVPEKLTLAPASGGPSM